MYTLQQIKDILAKYVRGDATEESDIDVLVDFDGRIGIEFISLAYDIEDLFNTKVDVVSKGGIKPAYFEYVSQDLIYV